MNKVIAWFKKNKDSQQYDELATDDFSDEKFFESLKDKYLKQLEQTAEIPGVHRVTTQVASTGSFFHSFGDTMSSYGDYDKPVFNPLEHLEKCKYCKSILLLDSRGSCKSCGAPV